MAQTNPTYANSPARRPVASPALIPAPRLASHASFQGGSPASRMAGPSPPPMVHGSRMMYGSQSVLYGSNMSGVGNLHRTFQSVNSEASDFEPKPQFIASPANPGFIRPIVLSDNATWLPPEVTTAFELGIHCTEKPPHYVQRVANTTLEDDDGFEAAMKQNSIGDEVIEIDGENITKVEMSRIPHLVLGVFASDVTYTLKSSERGEVYYIDGKRVVQAQMFQLYFRATETLPKVSQALSEACFDLMDENGRMKDFLTDYLHDDTTLGLEMAVIGNNLGWGERQVGIVVKGGPADVDGRILPGDTLVAVDGVPVDALGAASYIRTRRRVVGSKCMLTLSRMGNSYEVSLPWSSAGMTAIARDLLHLLINCRTAIQTEFDRNTMLLWLDKAWAHAVRMQRSRMDGETYLANHLQTMQGSIFNKVGTARQYVDFMPPAGGIWTEINKVTSKTGELHKKLKILEDQLGKMSPDLMDANARCLRLEKENADLKAELERLRKQLEMEKKDYEAELARLRNMHDAEVKDMRKTHEVELRKMREQQEIDNRDFLREKKALENQLVELKGQIAPIEKELEHFRREYPKEKDLRVKAETEWQSLVRENAKLLAETESLIAAETRARDELDDVKDLLKEAREDAAHQKELLHGWAVLSPFMAGPPRLSPNHLCELLNDAGMRSAELTRLLELFKGPPREDVEHVIKVLEFLRGPPRRTLKEINEAFEAAEIQRAKILKRDEEITQLKEENMTERKQRLTAEMELMDHRQLAELSNRAWDDWKPMMSYLKGPPTVAPRSMADAMHNCGSHPGEILELLKAMHGPPPIAAEDILHILKAFGSEAGMSAENVQSMWAKLTSINSARWRKANLPEGSNASNLATRGAAASKMKMAMNLSKISGAFAKAGAEKKELPEDRYLNSVAKNVKEEEKASYLSSYETSRRLKGMLASHDEFKSMQGGAGAGAGP